METFVMSGSPYVTYGLVGREVNLNDPKSIKMHPVARPVHYSCFDEDAVVTVVPEFKPNSLWRALVTFKTRDDNDTKYFLAR